MTTPDASLRTIKPKIPEFIAAENRAKNLVEKAANSEAIRIVDELMQEVKSMHISNRFSPTKEPRLSNLTGPPNLMLVGLSEAKYKRQTLLIELEKIKDNLISSIAQIENTVMDIEATKIDD
jgi:hypothetical protein